MVSGNWGRKIMRYGNEMVSGMVRKVVGIWMK